MAIILGIDPGSQITGFGVIESNGITASYISCGCLRLAKTSFACKLYTIFSELGDILAEFKPETAAIEQVFVKINPGTALKLGQARGAAIVAVAQANVSLAEYSTRQVKQAVVGYGGATKEQVQHMIKHLLKLNKTPQADAADALAVAICHANMQRGLKILQRGIKQ